MKHLFVCRMVHIDNVPFIVKNGLWAKMSDVNDPCFRAIGNPDIIGKRTDKPVGVVPPDGVLGEFVPFYFSGHSPMLYNIVTGYGVPKIPQRDIVFLICDVMEMIEAGLQYCFTDGNATKSITRFYNSIEEMRELDWMTIKATVWKNTEDDYDRVRKKMAEFLVKRHVPASLIRAIVVKSPDVGRQIEELVAGVLTDCTVKVDTKFEYYYRGYD